MFSSLDFNEGLLFVNSKERINSIHMFFVFFPIDIVWMDSSFKVVDVKRNVKPFTPFVIPKSKSKYVLEVRKGVSSNISIGDKLDLKEKVI